MKLKVILLLFILGVSVKGWAAVLQPIALTLGAALMAFDLDLDVLSNIKAFDYRGWPRFNKKKAM